MSRPGRGFEFAVRVYYEDTDAGGVVYFANYLRFMERARTEWLRRLGFDQSELRERQGILFVVRNVEATYHLPARLDDALTVQSRLVSLSRVALRFDQRITRGDAVLVNGSSDVICVGAASLRPCRMPPPLLDVLADVADPACSQPFSTAAPTNQTGSRRSQQTDSNPAPDPPPGAQ
ncbi:MAG: tol-pal system-associated acyl-CoA thioesterase [Rhodocyclaceae bacterium]|nr:tol-pal system-associated acyl-CoA thioesterase [Rhodocyclaceae bacterium]